MDDDLEEFIESDVIVISTYRVRIAHSHTLKEGWRLSETTVESEGTDIDFGTMGSHAKAAHEIGEEEAKRRNRLEREYNRGVMNT